MPLMLTDPEFDHLSIDDLLNPDGNIQQIIRSIKNRSASLQRYPYSSAEKTRSLSWQSH